MTNIVYIMADDLGFGDLNETLMPRCHQLMTSLGTSLEFQTAAFCAPTRTALMTGKHPEKFGLTSSYSIQDYPGLPTEELLLSEAFQQAGYETGIFGKWHLGMETEQAPWNQGFDQSIGFLHGQVFYMGVPETEEVGIELYDDSTMGHSHQLGHDMLLNGTPIHSSQYSTNLFEDAAREWIGEKAAADEDFFAYIPLNAPHTPFSAPREYVDMYTDMLGITDEEYAILESYEGDVLSIPLGPVRQSLDIETFNKLSELLYFASVRAMDDAIADIYQSVVDAGIADDTLFMFASDNGSYNKNNSDGTQTMFGSNGPLRGEKGSEYEGGHRVANFIIWPEEIEAGEVIDQNIWVGDLYPTFLSVAGIGYGSDLDGVDVTPALKGDATFDRGIIVPHTKIFKASIVFSAIDGDMKYIRRVSVSRNEDLEVISINGVTEELYDLSVDIGETNNLLTDPQYSDSLALLREAYEEFGDEGLYGDDYFTTRDISREGNPLIVPEEWGSTLSSDDPSIIKYGTGSDDVMRGENDGDVIMGASGDDRLIALGGADTLIGGAGADMMFGGTGVDVASYREADAGVLADLAGIGLRGDAEGDRYFNIENLTGSDFDDTLLGDRLSNNIKGGLGDDLLYGRDGDDYIVGGNGRDQINGGAGADKIFGGTGIDTIVFKNSANAVIVDLVEGEGRSGDAQGDEYSNIENIVGSNFDDDLRGNRQNNDISGGQGDDVIHTFEGNDQLFGKEGDDFLAGGFGNDQLNGGAGADRIYGGAGIDTLVFKDASSAVVADLRDGAGYSGDAEGDTYYNIENILGGDFNDHLRGDDLNNFISGGYGDDFIHARGGDDVILGGQGDDRLFGMGGRDVLYGGQGDDFLDVGIAGASGVQSMLGGPGNDTYIYRMSSKNVMIGADAETVNGGNDRIVFQDLLQSDISAELIDSGNRNGVLLNLEWSSGSETGFIRIADQGMYIEEFEFADGTIMSAEDFLI